MFGISGQEFIVLLVAAAVILGPERLPMYTQQLANLVRSLRRMAQNAGSQVRSEMGPEFDDIDWRKFDPRQYDPRRIVRDALSDAFDPDDPLGLKDMQTTIKGDIAEIGQGLSINSTNGSNGSRKHDASGDTGIADAAPAAESVAADTAATETKAMDAEPRAPRRPRSFDDIT